MNMNMVVKQIVNIPFIWNLAQSAVGANQWKAKMYPSVFERKSGKLLDFGCSSGNETAMFLDFDYHGVDIDPLAIEFARKKFRANDNVQFSCIDIVRDEYKKDYFDYVLFAGTAHHLSEKKKKKVVPALMKCLTVGGKIHFFEPISQEKDAWLTKAIIRGDQGKHTRTKEAYEKYFSDQHCKIEFTKIFPNPYRIMLFPDFLYMRISR